MFLGLEGLTGRPIPKEDRSPAAQLARMSFAAVPQLLDALTNQRFTRAMRMAVTLPYLVPRVKDSAYQVICYIARRDFDPHGAVRWPNTKEEGEQMERDSWLNRVNMARSWWSEIQSRGEVQVLHEQVESGGFEAQSAVSRLVELDPKNALKSITKGRWASKQFWPRRHKCPDTSGHRTAYHKRSSRLCQRPDHPWRLTGYSP